MRAGVKLTETGQLFFASPSDQTGCHCSKTGRDGPDQGTHNQDQQAAAMVKNQKGHPAGKDMVILNVHIVREADPKEKNCQKGDAESGKWAPGPGQENQEGNRHRAPPGEYQAHQEGQNSSDQKL